MNSLRLPSKYQIGDDIELFIPGEHVMLSTDTEIPDDVLIEGMVVGVRFTRSKVFYDVLSDSNTEVLKDLDSAYVIEKTLTTTAQA